MPKVGYNTTEDQYLVRTKSGKGTNQAQIQ